MGVRRVRCAAEGEGAEPCGVEGSCPDRSDAEHSGNVQVIPPPCRGCRVPAVEGVCVTTSTSMQTTNASLTLTSSAAK